MHNTSQRERSNALISQMMATGRLSNSSRVALKDHHGHYMQDQDPDQRHTASSAAAGASTMTSQQNYHNSYDRKDFTANVNQNNNYQKRNPNHGGGGDYEYRSDCSIKNNDDYINNVRHKISQTEIKTNMSGGTYSHYSSGESDISKQTALEKQSKKGKQLLALASSQANLIKTIDDGITGVNHHQDQCCCKTPQTKAKSCCQKTPNIANIHPCDSDEEFLPCSPSPSAGLINEKFIHPMVKKFRLLYLHNIKKEIGIMEDLEVLPNQLARFCKEMERDLPKN